ncbi:MAG TPA: D-alanine--D-alanine ligase [Myxococcota bacterium]|nr:D-alanine--D-alanine ligase [Myxococcota bacterium]HQK51585.1 D-alanine--D-alanine ligase [Myxococcota bacterium]
MDEDQGCVVVFFGGPSREHDVSLRSGAAVVRGLQEAGFPALPVRVTRQGAFQFPPLEDLGAQAEVLALPEALARIRGERPVCAFPALHGVFGEDGRIQALCDWMGLPCVGADVAGSSAALDKVFAKALFRTAGIPTPAFRVLETAGTPPSREWDAVVADLGLPFVAKVPREGSSFGVHLVRDRSAWQAIPWGEGDGRWLLERYHAGREFTVPVLEDPETGAPKPLPVIEIRVASHAFFDTESKYDPRLAQEICPAPIPEALSRILQDLGVRAHRALALAGFSRTDFLVDEDGPWALETNTIPGLTEVSLFPKAAAVAGISFPDLMRRLVRGAIRRHRGSAGC